MTRFDSTSNQTEATKASIRMFMAVDLDFISGHVRAHDGVGTISFGGHDYLGVGQYAGIEVAEETIDVIAKPLTLTLSGVDTSLMSTLSTEQYQGRSAVLYLGFLDTVTNALVDTPETVGEWRMNQMSWAAKQGEGSITLSCEPRLRREPRIARYTDADQTLAHSGDTFFSLIAKIPGFRGTWGTKGVANDGQNLVPVNTTGYGFYNQWGG